MSDRVSTKEIDKANEVHVVDYLVAKGEPIEKTGSHYYKHAEHDSLVLNTNGKWYWNSRGTGGFGAISLAKELYGLKFQDAVRDVNGQELSKIMEKEIAKIDDKFVYPHHYEKETLDNTMKYLTDVRKIDPKIVLALQKHDLIAEDKLNNIVFKWRDKDGNIVGADRQGTKKIESTRGYFKQIMANSKGNSGFTVDIGQPDKIAFFESPIDALSYFDLKRPQNIRLLSMSGLKDQTFLQGIKQLAREIKERKGGINGSEKLEVIIAVDNDKAGEAFRQKWSNMISPDNLTLAIPNQKDWNDDLRQTRERNKLHEKKIEKTLSNNKFQGIER